MSSVCGLVPIIFTKTIFRISSHSSYKGDGVKSECRSRSTRSESTIIDMVCAFLGSFALKYTRHQISIRTCVRSNGTFSSSGTHTRSLNFVPSSLPSPSWVGRTKPPPPAAFIPLIDRESGPPPPESRELELFLRSESCMLFQITGAAMGHNKKEVPD